MRVCVVSREEENLSHAAADSQTAVKPRGQEGDKYVYRSLLKSNLMHKHVLFVLDHL